MPRDGAIIFSDLIGKLDVLRIVLFPRLGNMSHQDEPSGHPALSPGPKDSQVS